MELRHTKTDPGENPPTIIAILPQKETTEQNSQNHKEARASYDEEPDGIAIFEMASFQNSNLIPNGRRVGRRVPARSAIATRCHGKSHIEQASSSQENRETI